MVRILTISVAVASLLAGPVLCVGGVISHACHCDSETACACQSDCEQETDCGHEGGCPDDPCSIRIARPERQDDDSAAVAQPAAWTTIIPATVKQPWVASPWAGTLDWPGVLKLPFPPSDRPLLI